MRYMSQMPADLSAKSVTPTAKTGLWYVSRSFSLLHSSMLALP